MSNDNKSQGPSFKWALINGQIPVDGKPFGERANMFLAEDGWTITAPAPGVVRLKKGPCDVTLFGHSVALQA